MDLNRTSNKGGHLFHKYCTKDTTVSSALALLSIVYSIKDTQTLITVSLRNIFSDCPITQLKFTSLINQ